MITTKCVVLDSQVALWVCRHTGTLGAKCRLAWWGGPSGFVPSLISHSPWILLLQLHEAKQALTYTVIPSHSVGTFRGLGWNWNQPKTC